MNHHRAVFLVVGAGVFKLEAFGQIVVYLYGAQLPAATYGILHHEVELGTVEGCLALYLLGVETLFAAGFYDGIFCKMPVFVAAYVFGFVLRVAQRNLSFEVLEIERFEDVEDNIHHL